MGIFEDKIALVTGGGRGIGAACALAFAREGAKVVVASRTKGELHEVVLKGPEGQIHAVPVDVGSEESVKDLFAEVRALGGLDFLLNAAGVIKGAPFEALTTADWEHMWQVNVMGAVHCIREAFPLMKERNGGAIVNLSSLGGLPFAEKFAGFSAYGTTKFAISGLTEALAVEGKPYGIRVNALAPGAVDTKMLREAAPFLKTNTKPEDLAGLVTFLCDSRLSGSLSGAVIPVYTNEE